MPCTHVARCRYGWREWYDLSWVADEVPPLPAMLSGLALVALLAGGWVAVGGVDGWWWWWVGWVVHFMLAGGWVAGG